MSSLECKNLAEQMKQIFYLNKFGMNLNDKCKNLDLFNLHITNLKSSNNTRNFLYSLFDPKIQFYFPNVFLHENSFTQIFKEKNVIYLSPHATEELTEYNHESFYIIGGIVDRRNIIELTPERSRELGIKSIKLPTQALLKKQILSLVDVFKFLHQFKYNPSKLNKDINISSFIKNHIKT